MKNNKNKKYKIIIKLLILIILFLVVLLFIRNCSNDKVSSVMNTTTNVFEQGSLENTTIPNETLNASNTTIAIPGYEIIEFKANSKQQIIALNNPIENKCYFKITLLLEDGTVLWVSNLIEPGGCSDAIFLSKELDAGKYKAILRYECYSIDGSMKQLNSAETKLSLRVN